MLSHPRRPIPVLPLCLGLTLSFAPAEETGEFQIFITTSDINEIPEPFRREVQPFLDKLPKDHRVRAELVRRHWGSTTDSARQFLKSMTPIGSDGKEDGEAFILAGSWPNHLLQTIPYKKGVKDGTEKRYGYHGKWPDIQQVVEEEIPWVGGKIHGTKRNYHPNGKLLSETPYDHGEPEGVSKEYDLAGRLKKVVPMKNGKRHGEAISYYPLTGKPERVVPYKKGVADGVVREYYDNGKLRREIPTQDDEFQGIEKQFSEDGTLVKTRYWLHDEEVSEEEFEKKARKR